MSNTTSNALAAIDEEIEALEERLEALKNARDLLDTGSDNGDEPKAKPAAKAASGSRRERVTSGKSESKSKSSSKAKSNGDDGESRKDQIIALLKAGKSAREIADTLGTHVGYVYTVKRSL